VKGIEAAFVGRLGQEPELRTSQSGRPWLRLSVAVGQDDDLTWVSTAVFDDRAQELAGHLHKGDKIYVEGRLTLRTWEKTGQTQTGISIAAWKVEKLGAIGRNKPPKAKALPEGEHSAAPAMRPKDNSYGQARQSERHVGLGDEIPF
jgi:single-strand DNA-binding protein